MRCLIVVLMALLGYADLLLAESIPGAELESALLAYTRDYGSKSTGAKLDVCRYGQQTVDMILDFVEHRYETRGDSRVPLADIKPMGRIDSLLASLNNVNAPLPVDRLGEIVESGVGMTDNRGCKLETTLVLLAQSGHPKGLTYIRYVIDQAARSHADVDKKALPFLRDLTNRWMHANAYLERGVMPPENVRVLRNVYDRRPVPFEVGMALQTMRSCWKPDDAWEQGKLFALTDKHLEAKLRVLLPRLLKPAECLTCEPRYFGRFHEKALAPLLLSWLSGDRQPLETLMGGRPVYFNIGRQDDQSARMAITELLMLMTGDVAFAAKKKMVQDGGTSFVMFDCDDPEKVLPVLSAIEPTRDQRYPWAASVIWTMAKRDRPSSDGERKALARALRVPRMHFGMYHWTDTNIVGQLAPLARRERDIFVQALEQPHVNRQVMALILSEKLSSDTNSLLAHIKYGMLHYHDNSIDELTPEQFAKLPPFVRAMQETDRVGGRRINMEWLDLLPLVLPEKAAQQKFAEDLAADPEFISASDAIRKYQPK